MSKFIGMPRRTWIVLLHILGCITFLCLPILFSPEPVSLNDLFTQPMRLRDFVAYACMIVFFYLNYFIFIPKLYFRRRFLVFSLVVAACFAVICLAPLVAFRQQGPSRFGVRIEQRNDRTIPPGNNDFTRFGHKQRSPSILMGIGRHLFIFLVVVLFSLILKISNRWKESEKERLRSEVSYLKAQINPHFLFNSLNSIYALALAKSDQAPIAVVKLAAMMRYVTSEAGNDFVPLEKELEYIRNYFELQRLRFGKSILTSLEVSGDTKGKKIAPLLLIPFVENAFKHGVNAEEDSLVNARVNITGDQLHFHVYNNKVHVSLMEEDKIGLGISNTKQRLDIIYPGAYNLQIEDREKYYAIDLKMDLS